MSIHHISQISNWKASEPDIRPVVLQTAVGSGFGSGSGSGNWSFESSSFYTEISTVPNNGTEFEYDTSTAKIWPWALLGSIFFLMVLLLLILLLKRCCQKSKKPEEKDLERSDSYLPHIKPEVQEAAIPLLDREPSSMKRERTNNTLAESSAPYHLTPSESEKKNLVIGKREDFPPFQSYEDIKPIPEDLHSSRVNEEDSASKTPERSSQPIDIPLNSINRDSKAKIPFKNQLSSDADSDDLRHIDSSSSEDSIPALPYKSSEKKPSNINLNVDDTENDIDSSDESNDRQDSSNAFKEGNPNIEQNIDMKKFYLIRKASEPPELPPKNK